MCGECKTCAAVSGGYQVHLTLNTLNDKVEDYFESKKIETIYIINYDTFYNKNLAKEEIITSKNYKTLEEAVLDLSITKDYLLNNNIVVQRSKIESMPYKLEKYLYREIHYKVNPTILEPRFGLNPDFLFSRNRKNSHFLTQRLVPGEEPEKITNFFSCIVEDVIYDSNINWDYNNGFGKKINLEKVETC